MPVSTLPIAAVSPGNVLTSTNWNAIVKDNLNKLLNTGHRVLTVAQFAALGAPEGTKGTIAPDEVYLEVDAANGIQWHLAYESGEATYKWRFLGGPPLRGFANANTVINTATQVGATGYYYIAGMSLTTPRGGDYEVQGWLDIFLNAGAAGLIQGSVFNAGALVGVVSAGPIIAAATDATLPIAGTVTGAGSAAAIGIAGTSTVPGTHKLATYNWFIRPVRLI